ncbi:hypothetical protein ACK3TF_001594 [Chlorella vulgaris]
MCPCCIHGAQQLSESEAIKAWAVGILGRYSTTVAAGTPASFPRPAWLFRECCYLALAVSQSGTSSGETQLLLLSHNLLGNAATMDAATAHPLHLCFAGATILAGQPLSLQPSLGQRECCDTAAAELQCGADTFICLPFNAPLAAGGPAMSCALLLGSLQLAGQQDADTEPPASAVRQRPQENGPRQHVEQQPREEQHDEQAPAAAQSATAQGPASHCTRQCLQSQLLQVAALLVQHCHPELAAAEEALAAAAGGSVQGSSSGNSCSSGGDMAQAFKENAAQQNKVANAPGEATDTAAGAAPAEATAAARTVAESGSMPASTLPMATEAAAGVMGRPFAAAAASASPVTAAPAAQPSEGTEATQRQGGPAPAANPAAAASRHPLPLLLPLRQLLQYLQLPPGSGRGMDTLLRFIDASPGQQPDSRHHTARLGMQPVAEGLEAGQHLPVVLQSPLGREFRRYHSSMMADKVDATGCLILLSILILLTKQPAAVVGVTHPLFLALAASLALPLLVLAHGPLRVWYVEHREPLLQTIFMLALLVQQASANFLDTPASQRSQARFINAGFAWITVDGLLLQMRFCRQLPTLLICFLLNLGAVPDVCSRYHPHLNRLWCLAAATSRGILFVVVPLFILYLLELRVRRAWLRRHQQAAAQHQEARQQRRRRLLRRRNTPSRAASSEAGTSAGAGSSAGSRLRY